MISQPGALRACVLQRRQLGHTTVIRIVHKVRNRVKARGPSEANMLARACEARREPQTGIVKTEMSVIRAFFALFATLAALLALGQHLGLDLWNCASCSFVSAMPLSSELAWTGPVLLAALTYGLYRDYQWARIGAGLTSLASIALIAWMLRHHTICLLCVLTHLGVLAAGVASLPRVGILSAPAFAVAIAFTATGGWEKFTLKAGVAIFRPRDRETIPPGRVLVYFSDPECSRCHLVEAQLAKLPNKPAILYRWTLLPQNLYRTMRAAALLETARLASESLFKSMRTDLASLTPPLTDSVLVAMAQKHFPARQVYVWLDDPPERALIALQDDRTTSQELGIQSLPALAELSAPDHSGTRTLRRIPFSEVGL